MNQKPIKNETACALLAAPIFPDSEHLFFPHNIYPPTDKSIEKVKEIIAISRNRVSDEQSNFIFKGSYLARSVPVEYRNDDDVKDAYKDIALTDNFNVSIAIESFVEYLVKENEYQSTDVRFREIANLTHKPPFPTHPLIEEVRINDQIITAETHQIGSAVLDKLIKAAQECLDNCEHGGGFVPYSETEEYEDNFFTV